MRPSTAKIRNVALGAGVLAALVFGGGAALAEAAPAQESRIVCPTQFTYIACQKCCESGGALNYYFDQESGRCDCY